MKKFPRFGLLLAKIIVFNENLYILVIFAPIELISESSSGLLSCLVDWLSRPKHVSWCSESVRDPRNMMEVTYDDISKLYFDLEILFCYVVLLCIMRSIKTIYI